MDTTKQMTTEDKIFENHYNYYKNIGIETIKQQAGQLQQVSSDYQGRVIYELLQNAFDKAEERILVQVKDNSLYVANDGIKFTYTDEFGYEKGTSPRGDFQSMCSFATSTKNANTSIGNKGVGFKSVFSIAEKGYVNVYTQGEIIGFDRKETTISFKIYDFFKDENNIPNDFEETVKINLKEKIRNVQMERKERGVPGYYFPLRITQEKEIVKDLFANKYVTVIEVPFASKEKKEVKKLYEEIKKIHFNFVKLKYSKNFKINFVFDEEHTEKDVENNLGYLFSAEISNNNFQALAMAAGVPIEHPNVAIYIGKNSDSLMYNYLPTKVISPFNYIDFHADFHTTIDRNHVNWVGKIGEYNEALLRACLELYFVVLNSYLDVANISLDLKYIENKTFKLDHFDWKWINFSGENYLLIFRTVRAILKIEDYIYDTSISLFSSIAKKYFSGDTSIENEKYNDFYNSMIVFIDKFSAIQTVNFHPKYPKIERHKQQFAHKLKEIKADVIPDVRLGDSVELLYRKDNDSKLKLPDFLGINITSFDIKDDDFRQALGIKDFNDYNEILKYYKQCSFTGEHSEERIAEEQQKELILSLFWLFEAKTDQNYLTTHRFSKAYNSKLRATNSVLNQAYFNISTIFIKTTFGTYKPAQLCKMKEINGDFLPSEISADKKNKFLIFLGVSEETNYIFSDIRIFDKLKNGISYIPKLRDRKTPEDISEDLINNLYIIKSNGDKIHPALINDNNYKFLESINSRSIKPELDNLLRGGYDRFPQEYNRILLKRINESLSFKADVIRLYQSIFHLFADANQLFLTIQDHKLEWISAKDFILFRNKIDFDLCIQFSPQKRVLCYYTGQNIDQYNNLVVTPQKGNIQIQEKKELVDLKKRIEERIIYLLLSLSYSKNSEINYLDDDKDISDLQQKINGLNIFEGNKLLQEISFDQQESNTMINHPYAFENKSINSCALYFNAGCTLKDKSEGIAEYLFANKSISESVELIIFHKKIDELKNEFDSKHIEIICRKWKSDYSAKYVSFQKEILSIFDVSANDDKWYIYNKDHKSKLLIKFDEENKIDELRQQIKNVKEEYIDYFENFEIEIDYSHITEEISMLITFLESKNDNNLKMVDKLKQLSKKLGQEDKINEIKSDISVKYPDLKDYFKDHRQAEKAIEIDFERKIDTIAAIANTSKILEQKNLTGKTVLNGISINSKKLIFQGIINADNPQTLETMGASGEVEVLIYFIEKFIELPIEKRLKGIEAVYEVIKTKIGNNSIEKYKTNCLAAFNNNSELKKALIPLFYITMHYKYSYFDLVVYKDDHPVLIEVKTTNNDNNKRFFLSIAEINAARGTENYEIVRVTPTKIYFIGNPIKLVEDNIMSISGDNFTLTPTNYKFEFK
jgi:hypothetical protein